MSHDLFSAILDVWSDTAQNSKGADPQVMLLGPDKPPATGCSVDTAEPAAAPSFSCQYPQHAHSPPLCLFHGSAIKKTPEITEHIFCCKAFP